MTEKRFRRAAFTVTAAAAAVIGLFLAKVEADTAAMPSINLPNPYAAGIKFGQMPEGRQWGGVIAVTPDRDGGSIWAFERCGGNCVTSDLPPVLGIRPDRHADQELWRRDVRISARHRHRQGWQCLRR
jgi:hypothetical protein